MTAQNLPTVLPDFDTLNSGFKEYLSKQDEYTDYNFNGSASSTLLDVMSLNTTYLAFFMNQVANESRLYTAIKRSSVVDRVHDLSYTVKTATAAKATLQYEYIKDSGSSVFTPFSITPTLSANVGNSFYIFTSTQSVEINEINGRYLSEPFDVYEGKRFTYTQSITDDILKNGFIIPNLNVDITQTTIDVINTNNVTTSYTLFSDLVSLKPTDNVFFYHENADGRIVLNFGDGILGSKPEYLVCAGSIANGFDVFTPSVTPVNGKLKVLVVNPSAGGSEPETIESMKKMAPLMYTTQNRAVIDTDYVSILKAKYNMVEDAISYGGDTLDPPQYGKVIVVVKPKNGLFLTTYDKSNIVAFLKKYNMITVTPIIYEPDYIYINLRITVIFDGSKLSVSEADLTNKVNDAIKSFESNQLSSFDKDFHYSVFLRTIDFCDSSIIANSTKIFLEKRINPVIGGKTFFDVTFNNQLNSGTISSSTFTYQGNTNCFIDDSQMNGVLAIYRYQNNVKTLIANNIGTVNYAVGKLSVPNITIGSLDNVDNANTQTGELFLSIYATPYDNDISITQRNIGQINTISLTLNRV